MNERTQSGENEEGGEENEAEEEHKQEEAEEKTEEEEEQQEQDDNGNDYSSSTDPTSEQRGLLINAFPLWELGRAGRGVAEIGSLRDMYLVSSARAGPPD